MALLGSNFDLKVQILDGSQLETVFASCVNGITRNPALAKRIDIHVGYVGNPGNETQVVVWARIGTTDASTVGAPKCAGLNSATGLRLYYGPRSRSSGIWDLD